MEFNIRNFQQSDLDSLYNICLLTGDSGKDASKIYKDPLLLGHFYAAPYAVFHPELTFILTKFDKPIGYILGTDDSEKFSKDCEDKWFPKLRAEYPFDNNIDETADSRIISLIHKGYVFKKELKDFPAHLHIDILPDGQGKGMGKKLLVTFIEKLKSIKVKGLHLEVGKENGNAVKFYENFGFKKIVEYEYSIAFGLIL